VFITPQQVPVFSGEDIASIASFGDLKMDQAKRLLEDFRAMGLILVGKVGQHRRYYYTPVESAIFKVLTELHDFGVCDQGLHAAALGMRAWSADNPPVPGAASPIGAAMAGCWQGGHWGLVLTVWRSDQGAPRHFAGFCHAIPSRNRIPHLSDDYQPHVMVSIDLGRLLRPLFARMVTALRSRRDAAHA
jgi:hypothetical protein